MTTFKTQTILDAPIEKVHSYFQKPEALLRLSPASLSLYIKKSPDHYTGKILGFSFQIKRIIHPISEGQFKVEEIIKGRFQQGSHLYHFIADGEQVILKEEFHYPLSWFKTHLEKEINFYLAYSHRVLKEDLKRLIIGQNPCTVLLTGGTGLIGKQLTIFLRLMGYKVFLFSRKSSEDPRVISWDPHQSITPLESLPKADVVIHLAGESILGLWTKRKKQRILQSRIDATEFLAQLIETQKIKPKIFISASADGIYPLESLTPLTENSPYGDHFLAKICTQWEFASWKVPADRSIQARFSPVYSLFGGIFSLLYPLFRLGLGAVIGDPSAQVSWIYLDDLLYQIHHMILTPSLSGPVNVVAPHFTTNSHFAHFLATTLKKPLWIKIPRFLAHLLGGSLASNLILTNRNVIPKKIIDSEGTFSYPNIDKCIFHMVGCTIPTNRSKEE